MTAKPITDPVTTRPSPSGSAAATAAARAENRAASRSERPGELSSADPAGAHPSGDRGPGGVIESIITGPPRPGNSGPGEFLGASSGVHRPDPAHLRTPARVRHWLLFAYDPFLLVNTPAPQEADRMPRPARDGPAPDGPTRDPDLRSAFDHAPIGIAVLTPDGVVIAGNTALGEIPDRPPDQLVGTPFFDVPRPDDLPAPHRGCRLMQEGRTRTVRLEC